MNNASIHSGCAPAGQIKPMGVSAHLKIQDRNPFPLRNQPWENVEQELPS